MSSFKSNENIHNSITRTKWNIKLQKEKLCCCVFRFELAFGTHIILAGNIEINCPHISQSYSLQNNKVNTNILYSTGKNKHRNIETTKPKRGCFRRFSHRHHITHKMTKKSIFQDDDSGNESPSKYMYEDKQAMYEVKQAKTFDEEDLRESAAVGSNENDRLMELTNTGESSISNDIKTLLNHSSTEESTTVESEEKFPFIDEDDLTTNHVKIMVGVHNDLEDFVADSSDNRCQSDKRLDYLAVQRSVDSDDYLLSTSGPSSVLQLTPATSDDESKVASSEPVPTETIKNDDTEFVEQMCKLSISKEENGMMPSNISAYLKQAGMTSLKAKSFLEWLYLHDGTLNSADNLCIGYENDTPDQLFI